MDLYGDLAPALEQGQGSEPLLAPGGKNQSAACVERISLVVTAHEMHIACVYVQQ
jgi:hypothetical protein